MPIVSAEVPEVSITLRVPGRDHLVHAEQYEALVSDLEAQGRSVGVALEPEVQIARDEEIVLAIDEGAAMEETLSAVAGAVRRCLRGRRIGASELVVICGANGRILDTVEIDSDPTRLDERD